MTNQASNARQSLRPHARRLRKRLRDLLGDRPLEVPAAQQAENDTRRPASPHLLVDGHLGTLLTPYSSAIGLAAAVSELFLCLPEMRRFLALINGAHEDYMPSWPPLSPISHSHFTCWSLFDATIDAERETIGTLLLDLARDLAVPSERLPLIENMQHSRMGLFVREDREGNLVWLREVGTGIGRRCTVANGYLGEEGELWFTRILPSPLPVTDIHVVLTNPYIIVDTSEADWRAFFTRTLRKTGIADKAQAFEHLMKYGLGPRYWLEYIFEAYAGDTELTIWLRGLPDDPGRDPRFAD